MILNDKEGHIKVNGKVRTDYGFPTGLMGNHHYIISLDIISIEKTNEHFRIFYDVAGRFVLKSIKPDEA
jgi:small subunit ribosomal protein S4e